MLSRLWRTGFDPGRLDELQRFASEVSAPMFQELPGCLGYIFAVEGSSWITQTFWESRSDLNEAEASERYRSVVAEIGKTGFLRDPQTTEVFTITAYEPPAPDS